MVAVPLFWMVTTAIKTNKELYEDFSYFPQRPTLENFVRVIVREKLLINIRNSFSVAMVTTLITVIVSSLAAYSIVRYRYPGREWIGRLILFKYLLPSAMLFVPLYVIVTALGLGNTQQGLILTYLTFTIPFCTWMLMGYFRGMPVELEEQADGRRLHQDRRHAAHPVATVGARAWSPRPFSRLRWPGTSFYWPWSSPWTSAP